MELRHLRCFLAVAEELHFARTAERLHIEQAPLSRAIKELEEELGMALFARPGAARCLTRAGKLLFPLQRARDNVKAADNGFHSVMPSRLPALCQQEEPEVEIRLVEVPLSQQIKGCTTTCTPPR